MIFGNRNEEPLEIMPIHKLIPSKESIQFLAMTQNSRLNQEEYINKLRAKTKRALNTVRVVAGKNGKEIGKP